MNEGRWPGEERLAGTEQQLGPEVPEDEVDLEPGEEELAEAEAEAAPPEEQLDEDESRDTPVPAAEEEAPAEEDELPRLRGPGHAAGALSIPDGYDVVDASADGGRRSVGIVVSRFNGEITNRLLESALDELERAGVARDAVTIIPVPGAFELPLGALALAKTRRVACVIALGCVIRGETAHFEYVAGEAASGLQLAALETGIPVSFGVLTLESPDQADARIEKGAEAVRSALEMADLFSQLRSPATSG
ncbi:MAG TPA: 6,7-dimethyl-8-ribityllumazine synthase [Gaiellaceae bacterium]|nr:6,7-dimethyl-8-ribityllumazine synthase [Gaiellaceae bacterium]